MEEGEAKNHKFHFIFTFSLFCLAPLHIFYDSNAFVNGVELVLYAGIASRFCDTKECVAFYDILSQCPITPDSTECHSDIVGVVKQVERSRLQCPSIL